MLLPDAHTGYDSNEPYTTDINRCGENMDVKFAFRRDTGVDGWDGPSGWYGGQNLPTPPPGSSVVVKGLYVFAWPAFQYNTFNTAYNAGPARELDDWVVTLRLVKIPDGVTYSGPTEWTLDGLTQSRLVPNGALPAYKTDDPLTGYRFEIQITHVPEPSCLLALLAGLGGFGAIVRRRR